MVLLQSTLGPSRQQCIGRRFVRWDRTKAASLSRGSQYPSLERLQCINEVRYFYAIVTLATYNPARLDKPNKD